MKKSDLFCACGHVLTFLKFSLHLNMAQECMSIFENQKLPAAASVEQVSHASAFSNLN